MNLLNVANSPLKHISQQTSESCGAVCNSVARQCAFMWLEEGLRGEGVLHFSLKYWSNCAALPVFYSRTNPSFKGDLLQVDMVN